MKTLFDFSYINSKNILKISKIGIFIFLSFFLVTNFTPFYDSNDSYTLGTMAIQISKGNFELSNELLKKTERIEFVPGDWAQIIDKKFAIPLGPIGFHGLTVLSYLIGNNYGLFYLGPIFGISSLIVADRLASKYFGESVGLLTLLFLVTNHFIIRSFSNLQTEGVFNFFFLIGCFFILKYFHDKKIIFLLIGSTFFSVSSFMRINGIIFFPIEIILILGFFMWNHYLSRNKISASNSNAGFKISTKFIAISFIFLFIPWSIFFSFYFSFNDHFFGDPFTNQRIIQNVESEVATIYSILSIENRHFENVKQFSKFLLPYQFPALDMKLYDHKIDSFGKNWLGIISILIMIFSLIIAFKIKTNRIEITTFILLILGIVWFYASLTSESRALEGVPGRYMMPAFTLFYMILGFIILIPFNKKKYLEKYFQKNNLKLIKIFSLIILVMFFSASFYFSPPVSALINGTFEIKNPEKFTLDHPPDLEGLSNSDVILALKTDRILEYDSIPFTILKNENGLMSDDSIMLLNQILDDNYSVYIFKKSTTINEKIIFQDLIENHNFLLREHSNSFCMIERKSSQDPLIQSESICLEN